MSLVERIDLDLRTAMKSSNKVTVSTLRIVKSTVKNREIEKGGNLTDDEVVSVILSLSKQRRESIEQFTRGGRDDLVASETAELEVLNKYLPEQLSEEAIDDIVKAIIDKTGAAGPGDIGLVMREVMSRVKGQADGKVINRKVSELLSNKK